VAVDLKPVPNASHNSGSQPTRLRVIHGDLSLDVQDLHASGASNADLNRSIEGGIAQASVMWLLHRGLEVVQDRDESLEQQIVQFSSAVFDAIGTNFPILRNAGQERLWLIYFKGLLTANTHPHDEMVSVLRNIASRSGFGRMPARPREPGRSATTPSERASDAEALQQIARSLEQSNGNSETEPD
jgi:hypothetical protein